MELLSRKTEAQESLMKNWFLNERLENYDTLSQFLEGSFATSAAGRHPGTTMVTIRHQVLNA